MTCTLYFIIKAFTLSGNIPINLFKHSAGLAVSLSKSEEKEPAADWPIQMIKACFSPPGGAPSG